jgi:pimeloyl-ACP methyl ester carboxylesterase
MAIALAPLLAAVLVAISTHQSALAERQLTRVEAPVRGSLVEHVTCPTDPSQTYTLYLPSKYETTRKWPLLLVFDPGGRAARAAEVFREAAERFGWIVAASENSRNGPWEPTLRAINAMWPALLGGYAVDERRVYAAGHSGGATVAWLLAHQTGQITGVIVSGQPNLQSEQSKTKPFAWFGVAGHTDFNLMEVKTIDEQLARTSSPHRMEFFDGGHQWPPADVIARALGWMEIVAMKEERRPRDLELARTLLAEDMARARALEDRALFTEAWRSYGAIAATYTGLVDASDAQRRARTLESDDRFKSARKTEERADRREQEQAVALARVLSRLTEDEVPLIAELRSRLNLDSLLKASRGEGYEAASASRSLALIRIQLSTIVRELASKHDARADVVQKVLDSIK